MSCKSLFTERFKIFYLPYLLHNFCLSTSLELDCNMWRCSKWRIWCNAPQHAALSIVYLSVRALSYGVLAVRNLRPDYGRCRPPGIHCTLRGNHLYSTPEVTEEHEIGKQLKHHSACEAQGTEKVKLFVLYVCFILFGSGWGHFQTTVFFFHVSSKHLICSNSHTDTFAH